MNAKVYTTQPGHKIQIGHYGQATYKVGVTVPDEVADQLEGEIRGHRPNPEAGKVWDTRTPNGTPTEYPSKAAALAAEVPNDCILEAPETLVYAQKRTDIRVERVKPDHKPASPSKAAAAPKGEEK